MELDEAGKAASKAGSDISKQLMDKTTTMTISGRDVFFLYHLMDEKIEELEKEINDLEKELEKIKIIKHTLDKAIKITIKEVFKSEKNEETEDVSSRNGNRTQT